MIITHATVKNFMAIELIEISSDGAVVQLAGDNGQGKTSAMLAIIGALGGKKALAKALGLSADPGDEEIIRRGEEMAEVVVKFGGWIVTWQRERGKSDKVEIRGTDGGSHGRAKLGELIGAIAFDPLELDGMSPAERRATLLEMAGIDLEEIDGRRAAGYQRRRDVNRDYKQALARVGEAVEGAPEEAVEIKKLKTNLAMAREQNAWNLKQRQEAQSLDMAAGGERDWADRAAAEAKRFEGDAERLPALQDTERKKMTSRHLAELADLTQRQMDASAEAAERSEAAQEKTAGIAKNADLATVAAKAALKAVKKLVDPLIDPLEKEIEVASEANELYRLAQERIGRHIEAEKLGHESRKLTVSLAKIDAEKVALLADAKMPIEGLGVSEDDVTIDGHLWETTNFSRRLRVCVAIAAEMAGELKIAFVRSGGNDLDKKNYAAFVKECKRQGLQSWIERNTPEGAGAIVIEAGLVAS